MLVAKGSPGSCASQPRQRRRVSVVNRLRPGTRGRGTVGQPRISPCRLQGRNGRAGNAVPPRSKRVLLRRSRPDALLMTATGAKAAAARVVRGDGAVSRSVPRSCPDPGTSGPGVEHGGQAANAGIPKAAGVWWGPGVVRGHPGLSSASTGGAEPTGTARTSVRPPRRSRLFRT